MNRAQFDGLSVIQRKWENRTGCADICRNEDGTAYVRVRFNSSVCQKEILTALDPDIPARLEDDRAEILLPYRDGMSLDEWLFERTPSFEQRKDACLSLLSQMIGDKLPACLLVPCVMPENVLVSGSGVFLQYVPNLANWEHGKTLPQAVCAVAGLFREILSRGIGRWPDSYLPEEWRLLCLRTNDKHYIDWGQLQRDISALPDKLPALEEAGHILLGKIKKLVSRYFKPVICVILAFLLVVSLLSLASAYRTWRNERQSTWSGVTFIGDQKLRPKQEVP